MSKDLIIVFGGCLLFFLWVLMEFANIKKTLPVNEFEDQQKTIRDFEVARESLRKKK